MKKAKMHVSSHMLFVINGGVLCHRDSPRTVNTKERAIALWSCIQLRYIKTQEGFPLSLSLQQVPSKLNNVWIRYHNRQPMTCFSWTPTQAMLGISFFLESATTAPWARYCIAKDNNLEAWIIDCMFVCVTFENSSFRWRRVAKIRPLLDTYGPWGWRDLYRATPALTRGLIVCGLIRRAAPFNHLELP